MTLASPIPADVMRFPQDYSAQTLALVDATIDRTRGESGITLRRAIAELIAEVEGRSRKIAMLPIGGITPKQLELYGFICEYASAHGYTPSYDEMRRAVGLKSKSGIHRMLVGLEERGAIKRIHHGARGISIIRKAA